MPNAPSTQFRLTWCMLEIDDYHDSRVRLTFSMSGSHPLLLVTTRWSLSTHILSIEDGHWSHTFLSFPMPHRHPRRLQVHVNKLPLYFFTPTFQNNLRSVLHCNQLAAAYKMRASLPTSTSDISADSLKSAAVGIFALRRLANAKQ